MSHGITEKVGRLAPSCKYILSWVKPAMRAKEKIFEFFLVSALSVFFLSKIFFYQVAATKFKPQWLDVWYMCFILKCQITRILGLNPGGMWEGGFYYPFHASSLLFDEPSWGISLLAAPAWALTKNIFVIFRIGGAAALLLSWIATYYFVKKLGATRILSFCAAATFCFSGVSLILISGQFIFWPFFFIPLLGLIVIKIFSTPKLYWGILLGILFGYLSWSSAHIFVMGGVFLMLFVLWNILFHNTEKKAIQALLAGLAISCVIASFVLGAMHFKHEEFDFFRGYYQPYLYSSNWANLIYRHWPDAPFNLITKTPLWVYIKNSAKGETNIGMSIFLLLCAAAIFIYRLKESKPLSNIGRRSIIIFIITMIVFIFLACLNICSVILKSVKYEYCLPKLNFTMTYPFYIMAGIITYALRRRLLLAMKHLDFYLLSAAIFFAFLAFGPYYMAGDNKAVVSPVAFLMYHAPGFSGIQATARWGIIFSFTLSIAVSIFLSSHISTYASKIIAAIFMLICILELSPGFRAPEFKGLSPYDWAPRQTDIFLKNLDGSGAVLEMESYPMKKEQYLTSDNSLGYALFSSLYHRKPLVAGYSSYIPHVTNRHLFYPEDKIFSYDTVRILRRFGARYWVLHIDNWPIEDMSLFKDNLKGLKQIGSLDNGKTLIYEDVEPKIGLTYYDIVKGNKD